MTGDQRMIERIERAILAELHRQGEAHGVTTEDNGRRVQVDGSFELRPIARAVLVALGKERHR